MTEIDAGICYIDNISNTLKVTYYLFKIVPKNIIRAWNKQTAILYNSIVNFSLQK